MDADEALARELAESDTQRTESSLVGGNNSNEGLWGAALNDSNASDDEDP
jgi:hypothetical protein